MKPSRWETYADGRRPDKARLVDEAAQYLGGSEVQSDIFVLDRELKEDLSRLKITTLAILVDVLGFLRSRTSEP